VAVTVHADVPLVGRDRELRRLVECFGRVRTGGAAVAVVEGEAGIGKSRLATAALRWACADGFTGLCAGGAPLQRDLSYAVVVEALRPLVHGPTADVAALVDGLGDLARLFDGLPVARPGPLGDAGLERTRLFEAVCGLVRRASRRGPLAVLIDDLQWADSESLAVFHYLVRGVADRPVLFVFACRTGEPRREVQELFTALRRGDVLTEIVLRPLGQDAVGSLVRALLGDEPPAALLRALTGRAGGVPLFVKELVGALVDSGALVRSGERWVLGAGDLAPLPRVVGDLLRGRIESLPAAARPVLDVLAVFGGQVTHALLREVVADDALLPGGIARLRAAPWPTSRCWTARWCTGSRTRCSARWPTTCFPRPPAASGTRRPRVPCCAPLPVTCAHWRSTCVRPARHWRRRRPSTSWIARPAKRSRRTAVTRRRRTPAPPSPRRPASAAPTCAVN